MTKQTILHDRHIELGAKMVDFAGWDMPEWEYLMFLIWEK